MTLFHNRTHNLSYLMTVCSIVSVGLLSVPAYGEANRSIHLVMPQNPSSLVEYTARILQQRITERCEDAVVFADSGELTVTLSIQDGIGTEGFEIAEGSDKEIQITGNDERGLLYGVGQLLHTSQYGSDGFTPSSWRGRSVPQGTFRCIYFASHFNNIYEIGPQAEITRYIEDLSLWGYNALMYGFALFQFDSLDDPQAQQSLAQIKQLMRTARSLGMKTVCGLVPNGGYASTPEALRRTPVLDTLGRRGQHGVNICSSIPEGHELLMQLWDVLIDEFGEAGLDYLLFWPYDEGGCGCKQCAPWGSNGYLKISRDITLLARSKNPQIQTVLSTWCFDTPPEGEWEGLAQALDAGNDWLDAIMADAHEDFPRYPLERGVPGNLPLYNFPEISMWGMSPWGGYGANPLPGRFQRLWDQVKDKVSGGAPYSEGIFEDINKTIISRFYWDRNHPAQQTVREYIAYEYSPQVVDDVAEAIQLMEAIHSSGWKADADNKQKAEREWDLIQATDKRLPERVRTSWRWRILYIRARLDRERFGAGLHSQAARDAFHELETIYHVSEFTSPSVRPPSSSRN